MLSENIRTYRKKNNLSQDELAEKLGVSRQSVSFWENGQTQPTIDNIIALAKIFNISSDVLLGNAEAESEIDLGNKYSDNMTVHKLSKSGLGGLIFVIVAIIICCIILLISLGKKDPDDTDNDTSGTVGTQDIVGTQDTVGTGNSGVDTDSQNNPSFDLFTYCKEFAIQIGTLNGDYVIYQQPSNIYGGYDGEYFSISYWADSDMVEFCLHCPLSETQSHNFYLRMRGGFKGKYEYTSSKYWRDTGESFRCAYGYIDPAVFYDGYPISCDTYEGDTEGQDQFMEDTRVGMCDLIRCLKSFVSVEKMECDFSAFGFKKF